MGDFSFKEIEQKWQKKWEKDQLYRTDMSLAEKKLYCLVMFLYPSGDHLHIGHWWNYGPTDTWARFKRMQGFNVFEPMGYDAFGLPAENHAIKKGIHPALSTANNIRTIREQLKAIGSMYDWSKEINTSDPEYYKWTQWFFLLLYKNGLAYRKKAPVNWCPSCKTVLANEQVVEGRCERCESEVTHRDLEQWFFKITAYADKLLEGLDRIDWPEKTKIMQRNWIGKSTGAWIRFRIADLTATGLSAESLTAAGLTAHDNQAEIEVFTTRPDTLWGVTYMVLAPEHPLVSSLTLSDRKKKVDDYVEFARRETEIERAAADKEKTGVFTGSYCINPVNGEKVPVWISDYVILTYGTGAVMAVPAHDERDFEFAKKFKLPIREVISPDGKLHGNLERAYIEPGIMVQSGQFSGQPSETGLKKVIDFLAETGVGGAKVNFKLRDWLISRQRYWGAPIPMIYCGFCGLVPIPENQLPVLLPEKVEFKGLGESPLVTNLEWLHTKCPKCGGKARREADTMDTFVCSSWYYLRFPNPDCETGPFDPDTVSRWLPVDQYVGGAEHAVMHLLYARFFTKVLYDLKMVHFDEPFTRLIHQGVITNQGAKMSKSRGNVINPDIYIEKYGSDVFRMYLMFMGAYTDGGDWSDDGIQSMFRFLNRVVRLVETVLQSPSSGNETEHSAELNRIRHSTIKMVTQDLNRFQFHGGISRIMELVNAAYLYLQDVPLEKQNRIVLTECLNTVTQLLAPFAPHLCEELWLRMKKTGSVFNSTWPVWDEAALKTEMVRMVVQINGKIRDQVDAQRDADESVLKPMVLRQEKLKKHLEGKTIVKFVVVKNKLISIAVKD